eukprot:gene3453-3782_t
MFIAEEKTSHREEQEKELAIQIMKEKELQSLEGLGQAPERDPRASSLKFMYAAPSHLKDKKGSHHLLAVPAPPTLDANGDDDQVRAFKAKLYKKEGDSSFNASSSSAPPPPSDDNEAEEEEEEEEQGADKRDFQRLSELEKLSGRRRKEVVTAEAMAQRHPSLKNAPTEGRYTQSLALHVKPFNEVIRNVRCLRCGEWGHASGDRECKLRDRNPLDEERQRREDPMTNSCQTSSCAFIGEDGESDPEAEFLATLTRREKKLLLRKLQALEGIPSKHVDDHKKKSKKRKAKHKDHHKEKKKRNRKNRSGSSDDDSNSSSSSDSSSSDESDASVDNTRSKR